MDFARLARGTAAVVVLGCVVAASAAAHEVSRKFANAADKPTIVVASASSDEDLGRMLYVSEAAVQRLKSDVPELYVQAALAAGDVEAALDQKRNLPTDDCGPASVVNNVVQSDCARVRVMHLIAASPAAAGKVDWFSEIAKLELSKLQKRDWLTSNAVMQAEGGDIDGAVATARSHGRDGQDGSRYEVVSALAAVAVAVANYDPGRALKIIQDAHKRCRAWCARDAVGSGYRNDIEWAFARIAWSQAEAGDTDGAKATIRLGYKLVGDGSDWLDRARRQIALAYAREGQLRDAVHFTETIKRADWRRSVKAEVEAILASYMAG